MSFFNQAKNEDEEGTIKFSFHDPNKHEKEPINYKPNKPKCYYAVNKGSRTGVFTKWSEVQQSIKGFSYPKFRKFETYEEAKYFAKYGKEPVRKREPNPTCLFDSFKKVSKVKFTDTKGDTYTKKVVSDGLTINQNADYIFTDGSCIRNKQHQAVKSGYGVWFGDNDPRNVAVSMNHDKLLSNQRAELAAILHAFELIYKTEQKLLKKYGSEKFEEFLRLRIIVSDSDYSINCVTKWYLSWESKNWKNSQGKDVKNQDLIKPILVLKRKMKTPVRFLHIKEFGLKSHGEKEPNKSKQFARWFIWHGNQQADKLAVYGSNYA
jgi:ribonuclease HI